MSFLIISNENCHSHPNRVKYEVNITNLEALRYQDIKHRLERYIQSRNPL